VIDDCRSAELTIGNFQSSTTNRQSSIGNRQFLQSPIANHKSPIKASSPEAENKGDGT
jgi:hypothetical protein